MRSTTFSSPTLHSIEDTILKLNERMDSKIGLEIDVTDDQIGQEQLRHSMRIIKCWVEHLAANSFNKGQEATLRITLRKLNGQRIVLKIEDNGSDSQKGNTELFEYLAQLNGTSIYSHQHGSALQVIWSVLGKPINRLVNAN